MLFAIVSSLRSTIVPRIAVMRSMRWKALEDEAA